MLQTEVESKGIGRSSVVLYLILGGRKNITTARRLGGAIGLNTKIVDDLLDGENISPVSNKEKFIENYVYSVSNGVVRKPVDQAEEIYAYTAGRELYRYFSNFPAVHKEITSILDKMGRMLYTEDKTQIEPYRKYVAAAGGLHGELLIIALEVCDDFYSTNNKRRFANCFGRALQIGDDIVDNDVTLSDGDLNKELQRAIYDLRSFGYNSAYILTLMRPYHLRLLIKVEKYIRDVFSILGHWDDISDIDA